MVRHSPQEVADFFGVYVAQDNEGKQWNLFADKPQQIGVCWYAKLEDGGVDYGMAITDFINASANHDWRTLYEPHTHETTHEKRMDNAPHQSNVYLHPEIGSYRTVTGYTLPEFDNKVHAAMKEGWKPVSMHVHSFVQEPKVVFYMAMVRGLE